jgi:hypothetical protein
MFTDAGIANCTRCLNSGEEFPASTKRIAEAVWLRIEKKLPINSLVFNTARALVHATATQPISRYMLQGFLRSQERDVKDFVRELRREWSLPIGSSRKQPFGYYFIYTAAEFLDWSRVYRSQAIDELVTLYKLQRRHFPELTGQESFQFAEAIEDQLREAL